MAHAALRLFHFHSEAGVFAFQAPLPILHLQAELEFLALAFAGVHLELVGLVELPGRLAQDVRRAGRSQDDDGVGRLVDRDGQLREARADVRVPLAQLLQRFHKRVGRNVHKPEHDDLDFRLRLPLRPPFRPGWRTAPVGQSGHQNSRHRNQDETRTSDVNVTRHGQPPYPERLRNPCASSARSNIG